MSRFREGGVTAALAPKLPAVEPDVAEAERTPENVRRAAAITGAVRRETLARIDAQIAAQHRDSKRGRP